jgi:hypothetical protein
VASVDVRGVVLACFGDDCWVSGVCSFAIWSGIEEFFGGMFGGVRLGGNGVRCVIIMAANGARIGATYL